MFTDVFAKTLAAVLSAAILGVSGTVIAFLKARLKMYKAREAEEKQEMQLIRSALQCLLHNQLFSEAKRYVVLGYIPSDDAEEITRSVDQVYHAYRGLGGNGTGEELYERFKKLPWKDK
jgi:hypothetical protein